MAWLEVVYLASDEERQQELVPLRDLLEFADAVGSTKRVISACCNRSQPIRFPLGLTNQEIEGLVGAEDFQWVLDGRGYYVLTTDIEPHTLYSTAAPSSLDPLRTGIHFSSEQQRAAAAKQLALNLESLVFLAYKLQQAHLQQLLHQVILANSMYEHSILSRELLDNVVFTPRVMAEVPAEALKQAYIDSHLVQSCSMQGKDALLDGEGDLPTDPIASIWATLKKEFMGCKSSSRMMVHLRLSSMAKVDSPDGQILPIRMMVLAAGHTQASHYQDTEPEVEVATP